MLLSYRERWKEANYRYAQKAADGAGEAVRVTLSYGGKGTGRAPGLTGPPSRPPVVVWLDADLPAP